MLCNTLTVLKRRRSKIHNNAVYHIPNTPTMLLPHSTSSLQPKTSLTNTIKSERKSQTFPTVYNYTVRGQFIASTSLPHQTQLISPSLSLSLTHSSPLFPPLPTYVSFQPVLLHRQHHLIDQKQALIQHTRIPEFISATIYIDRRAISSTMPSLTLHQLREHMREYKGYLFHSHIHRQSYACTVLGCM